MSSLQIFFLISLAYTCGLITGVLMAFTKGDKK